MTDNELVSAYFQALEGGDLEGLMKLFTPDAVVHSPLYGSVQARDFYTQLFADSGKSGGTLLGILGRGQTAAGRPLMGWWFRFDWVFKSGTRSPFDVVVLTELDDQNQIAVLHIIFDTAFVRSVFEKETGRLSPRGPGA